jgi:hypothetical protein
MIYLFAVLAPPRSGTKWFSKLFTMEHSYCFHELTTHLRPYPSNITLQEWLKNQVEDHPFEEAQRRAILQCYPEYFSRLWERAIYGQYIVGNSDSFIIQNAPGLWLLWPNMKFILSLRNGINCVESAYVHEANYPISIKLKIRKEYNTDNFFALCCHNWVKNISHWVESRKWLIERAQCIETRLEKITRDLNELRRVWDWVGFGQWKEYEKRNRKLMVTPMNVRVNQKKVFSAEDIWHLWSNLQRDIFQKICGETMTSIGYTIPRE